MLRPEQKTNILRQNASGQSQEKAVFEHSSKRPDPSTRLIARFSHCYADSAEATGRQFSDAAPRRVSEPSLYFAICAFCIADAALLFS
jgi:hypothetical protein